MLSKEDMYLTFKYGRKILEYALGNDPVGEEEQKKMHERERDDWDFKSLEGKRRREAEPTHKFKRGE